VNTKSAPLSGSVKGGNLSLSRAGVVSADTLRFLHACGCIHEAGSPKETSTGSSISHHFFGYSMAGFQPGFLVSADGSICRSCSGPPRQADQAFSRRCQGGGSKG